MGSWLFRKIEREQREGVFQGSHMNQFIFQRDNPCAVLKTDRKSSHRRPAQSHHSHTVSERGCHLDEGGEEGAVGMQRGGKIQDVL